MRSYKLPSFISVTRKNKLIEYLFRTLTRHFSLKLITLDNFERIKIKRLCFSYVLCLQTNHPWMYWRTWSTFAEIAVFLCKKTLELNMAWSGKARENYKASGLKADTTFAKRKFKTQNSFLTREGRVCVV